MTTSLLLDRELVVHNLGSRLSPATFSGKPMVRQ
jgi:hypothetical protein